MSDGCCAELAGLQDARGLELVEVPTETTDRRESLEGEIRRLEMPDEPTGELQDLHLTTVPGLEVCGIAEAVECFPPTG